MLLEKKNLLWVEKKYLQTITRNLKRFKKKKEREEQKKGGIFLFLY